MGQYVCRRNWLKKTILLTVTFAFSGVGHADSLLSRFNVGTGLGWNSHGLVLALSVVGIFPDRFIKRLDATVASSSDLANSAMSLRAYHDLWGQTQGRFSQSYLTNNVTKNLKTTAYVTNEQMKRRWYLGQNSQVTLNAGVSYVIGAYHDSGNNTHDNYNLPVQDARLTYALRSDMGFSTLSAAVQRGGDFLLQENIPRSLKASTDFAYTKAQLSFSQRLKLQTPWSADFSLSGQIYNGKKALPIFAKMKSNSPITRGYFDDGITISTKIGYQLQQPIWSIRALGFLLSFTDGKNKNTNMGYGDEKITDAFVTFYAKAVHFGKRQFKPFVMCGVQDNSDAGINGEYSFGLYK